MYFSLQQQLFALWQSFWLGIAIGVLLMLFRLWRRFCPSQAADFVRDFLFISGTVLLSGIFYLRVSRGQIRWFYLLAQLLGALVFDRGVTRWLLPLIHRVLCVLFSLLERVLRVLLFPFVRVFGWLFAGVKKLIRIIFKKLFIFIKKYIIILLHSVFRDRKKTKERMSTDGPKAEDQAKRRISQFYH